MEVAPLPDGVTLASLRTLPRQLLARECNPDPSPMKPVGQNGLVSATSWIGSRQKPTAGAQNDVRALRAPA